MDGPREIMTLDQAAEFMQIHYQTMWNLIKNKKIPAKKVGREWRVLRRDILEYMSRHDE